MTEDGQKYEHNKMFEEQCGIKRETITVVSLLFINLVIHCNRLELRNCVFSTVIKSQIKLLANKTWHFVILEYLLKYKEIK